MTGGDGQRVSHFVVVPNRAAAGQAAYERDRLKARIRVRFGQVLEVAEAQGRVRPAVRTQKSRGGPGGRRFEQRLVECHVGRARGDLVGKHMTRRLPGQSGRRFVHVTPPIPRLLGQVSRRRGWGWSGNRPVPNCSRPLASRRVSRHNSTFNRK